MSRYIKVEKAMELCDAFYFTNETCSVEWLFKNTPSIDIIRCGECISCKRKRGTFKGEPIIFYRCEENNRDVESDDYCSWGERSE